MMFVETESFFHQFYLQERTILEDRKDMGNSFFDISPVCKHFCQYYLSLASHRKIKIHKMSLNLKPHKMSLNLNSYRTYVLPKCI